MLKIKYSEDCLFTKMCVKYMNHEKDGLVSLKDGFVIFKEEKDLKKLIDIYEEVFETSFNKEYDVKEIIESSIIFISKSIFNLISKINGYCLFNKMFYNSIIFYIKRGLLKMAIDFKELARWDGMNRQWGMSGGASFLTDISKQKNGKEFRNAVYSTPLGTWNIGNRGVREEYYQELLSFFYVVRGRLYGFRMRDWLDYKDNGRGVIIPVTEKTYNYQLYKKRTIDTVLDDYFLQKIVKPVGKSFESYSKLGNTMKFFWNERQIIESTNPNDFDAVVLDDTTGLLSYNPSVSVASSINNGLFTVLSSVDYEVGDSVRFSLNGTTYNQNIIEKNNNNFRTDLTEVISSSEPVNFYLYPSANSNFKWTGCFDKPVRFDVDTIDFTAEVFVEDVKKNTTRVDVQLPSIPIVEIRIL